MGDYEYETDSGCLSVRVHLRDPEERKKQKATLLPYLGIGELQSKSRLFKSLMAELVGTLLLVLIGCGSCTGGDHLEADVQIDDQANIVRISLCFGITVATLAQTLGHVSGCHINPAITLGLTVGGKIGIIKGLLYIAFQCLGAVAGAAILFSILPTTFRGAAGLGQTTVNPDISQGTAVAVEMLITAVLVMVVFAAAADSNNTPSVKGSAPLAIGLSITACHLWAIPLTGSSMNPARTLGPSLIMNNTEHLWVYWVGPLLGGLLAALLYQIFFRALSEEESNPEPPPSSTPPKRRHGSIYRKGTPVKQVPTLPPDTNGKKEEKEFA